MAQKRQLRTGVVRVADLREWTLVLGAFLLVPPILHFGIAYFSKYGRPACVPDFDVRDPASLASLLVTIASIGALILWIVDGNGAGVIARLLPASGWPARPPMSERRVRWIAPLVLMALFAVAMFVGPQPRAEPSPPCEVSVISRVP